MPNPKQNATESGPSHDQVLESAIRVLSEITQIDPSALGPHSAMDTDLKLRSIDLVEFQLAMEEEFDVELDPIGLIELNVLGKMVAYIISETGSQSSQ